MLIDCAFVIVESIMFHSLGPATETACWAMLVVFLDTKRLPFTADLLACPCMLLIPWKDSLHVSEILCMFHDHAHWLFYTWVPLSRGQPSVWCSTTQNHSKFGDGLPHQPTKQPFNKTFHCSYWHTNIIRQQEIHTIKHQKLVDNLLWAREYHPCQTCY